MIFIEMIFVIFVVFVIFVIFVIFVEMIFIGSFCVVEIDPVFHYINICVGFERYPGFWNYVD